MSKPSAKAIRNFYKKKTTPPNHIGTARLLVQQIYDVCFLRNWRQFPSSSTKCGQRFANFVLTTSFLASFRFGWSQRLRRVHCNAVGTSTELRETGLRESILQCLPRLGGLRHRIWHHPGFTKHRTRTAVPEAQAQVHDGIRLLAGAPADQILPIHLAQINVLDAKVHVLPKCCPPCFGVSSTMIDNAPSGLFLLRNRGTSARTVLFVSMMHSWFDLVRHTVYSNFEFRSSRFFQTLSVKPISCSSDKIEFYSWCRETGESGNWPLTAAMSGDDLLPQGKTCPVWRVGCFSRQVDKISQNRQRSQKVETRDDDVE